MPKNFCQLILGSQSPRRKELLGHTFLPFEIIVSDAEEISSSTSPQDYVMDLAKLKASDVLEKAKNNYTNPVVIGSDTVVVYQNKILEKPKDNAQAKEMLSLLSGKTHQVYTAVCVSHENGQRCFVERTEVFFDEIEGDLLDLYVSTGDSLDKAGAYGIQGAAQSFIKEISGSYSAVVGLPVNQTLNAIKNLIRELYPNVKDWRSCFEVS